MSPRRGETLQEQLEELREAWRDLFYAIASAVGIVWLTRRLGLKLKPWAREREIRERWKR